MKEGKGSATGVSNKKEGITFDDVKLNGSDVRVGIIKASWNKDILDGMLMLIE